MRALIIINKKEKGQALVFVVLIVFALIAMAALIADGGLLMLARRQAQVAADAGALAGARLVCNGSTNISAIKNKITNTYVTPNNATVSASDITVIIPSSANGYRSEVKVKAAVNYTPFFARIFGNTASESIPASATAKCLSPGAAGSVLPIGWNCIPPSGQTSDFNPCLVRELDWRTEMSPLLAPSGTVTIHDPNNPGQYFFNVPAGMDFTDVNTHLVDDKFLYVMVYVAGPNDDKYIADDGTTCKTLPGYTGPGTMNCDINPGPPPADNGPDGVNEILGSTLLEWMDYCGGNPVNCTDSVSVGPPGYPQSNGFKVDVFHWLQNTFVGAKNKPVDPVDHIAWLPIVDANPDINGNYIIKGFAAFYVTCVNDQVNPKPEDSCPGQAEWWAANEFPNNYKGYSVEGFFIKNPPNPLPGSGGINLGINYVSLTP